MKTTSLTLTFLCVLTTLFTTAQTIRRVNNIFGVTGVNVYSTLQAAHDAANPNDVILLEPSSVSYGDVTLTKPLKIYGNGYFLSTNTELKADQRNSTLSTIYFDSGSSGSEMYGTTFSYVYIRGASNLIIKRNNIGAGIILYNANLSSVNFNVTNLLIEQNYGSSGSYISPNPAPGFIYTNVSVNNNILGYMNANLDPYVQGWIVRNNTFLGGSTVGVSNSVFENNILYNTGIPVSLFNTTTTYNVSAGATFGGGIGNQDNVAVSTEVIGSGAGISADEFYQLLPASPLKTAGNAGVEVGAYGGPTPYVVSGIPAIPSIQMMLNSGSGSNATPLDVTISVKSNN